MVQHGPMSTLSPWAEGCPWDQVPTGRRTSGGGRAGGGSDATERFGHRNKAETDTYVYIKLCVSLMLFIALFFNV